MHGYELKKRLDEAVGVAAGVSYGSLYPALRRLEKAGAIEALDPVTPSNPIPATGSIGGETAAARVRRRLTPSRRKRKEYRITDRGLELLDELLKTDEDTGDDRAFALKLTFCRYLEPADRLTLFERRRAWLTEKLERMKTALRTDDGSRRIDHYTRSLIEHDDEATQRDLEWVTNLIESEQARATPPASRAERATVPSGPSPATDGGGGAASPDRETEHSR